RDPVEWSVRDVVDYFTEGRFPEQATAFQEQEIDGKSLLLMQRSDVLTGLSIRLGPALKIYEYHVKAAAAQPLPGGGAPPGALPRLTTPPPPPQKKNNPPPTPPPSKIWGHPGIREGLPSP
ncbi:sterile alpha motif domain-containing protein 1-like, partial [Chroicocephalus ridibundus]|uniref:sterile alpha motif domain-containing protein 1-like n=1 Tax=Chroicocephalus ridibundus TaxID=1192867 RepID=UPI002FDCB3DD